MSERLDEIIRLLHEKKKADEIYSSFDNERAMLDGHKAEDLVVDALSGVGMIEEVEREVPFGNEDRLGNDIIVRFKVEYRHDPVTVQVKSSWKSRDKFIQDDNNHTGSERRIVMVVGKTDSGTKIRKVFFSYLHNLDGFV